MSIASPPNLAPKSTKNKVSAEVARRELDARLRDTRQRAVRHRQLIGLASITSACAVAFGAVAVADYFWELALAGRATWAIGVVLAALMALGFGWKRWIASYTLSQAAIDAEGQLEQLGQRLRTTLDYEEPERRPAAASPALVAALHSESYQVAQTVEWDDVIDSRPLVAAVSAAAMIACMWMAALATSSEFRIAAARAFLLPAEYTTVTFTPQSKTVRLGESVTVTADVTGRPIQSAQLRFRLAGSQDDWTTVDLLPTDAERNVSVAELVRVRGTEVSRLRLQESNTDEESHVLLGALATELADLTKDLEFEVVAGPRALPPGSIRVLQPLTLEKSQAHIVPPEYTGKPDETVESLDLKVLEGSNVELTLELNRAAGTAKLVRQNKDDRVSGTALAAGQNDSPAASAVPLSNDIPLTIDGNFVRGTLKDLRKSTSFEFSAEAADGMALEPIRFQIRVQLDRKPQVQFIEPPEELVVTPTTDVPMLVEADDDLGLFKVGLMYQINGGPMETLIEQSAEGSIESFQLPSTLMLEGHSLSHQDAVTYFAFAEDNYFGEPRRTTTELRFIDIRPFKLAFQLLDTGGT